MEKLLGTLAPKRVVLNFLRIRRTRPTPVRVLIAVSEVFGFTGNATRVAIARLAKEGMIESDERGSYRLTDSGVSIAQHLEEWRLGEDRMRAWDGSWLAVGLPTRNGVRSERRASLMALEYMGLRQGLDHLWVRPNNLVESLGATREKLYSVGLERRSEIFVADHFRAPLVERWKRNLWNPERRDARYREMLERLSLSRVRLQETDPREAIVETFLTFADGVRLLARDPLLPEEIAPGARRRELTSAMIDYEALVREIWTGFIKDVMRNGNAEPSFEPTRVAV